MRIRRRLQRTCWGGGREGGKRREDQRSRRVYRNFGDTRSIPQTSPQSRFYPRTLLPVFQYTFCIFAQARSPSRCVGFLSALSSMLNLSAAFPIKYGLYNKFINALIIRYYYIQYYYVNSIADIIMNYESLYGNEIVRRSRNNRAGECGELRHYL